jgi:hypothetical protein
MLSNLPTHGKISDRLIGTQFLMSRFASNLRATGWRKQKNSNHAIYSQRNERFSATIRPFAINRQRQAITRPSSK